MTKIIGFLGRKQSGKNTCSNIIHGHELKRQGMIEDFKISDEGELLIFTSNVLGEKGWGHFDILRRDVEFVSWSERNLWPHIKNYAFADKLKDVCVDLFNVPRQLIYGTDSDKNTIMEHLLWENMPGVYPAPIEAIDAKLISKSGPMTVREFAQFFGTEIGRKIWSPIWVDYLITQIRREKSEVAIVTDVRFTNEAKAIKDAGGIIVKLNRKPKSKDNHSSETEVDQVPKELIDYQIQNNKKGYTLNDLQVDVKKLYDSIIL